MTFTEKAQQLRAALAEVADDEAKQVSLLTIALMRATAELCQVCRTGYGNGRGQPDVRCAFCRREPEVIVCLECARNDRVPSWGS